MEEHWHNVAGSAVPGGKQGETEGNNREGRERDGPLLPVQLQPQRSGWRGEQWYIQDCCFCAVRTNLHIWINVFLVKPNSTSTNCLPFLSVGLCVCVGPCHLLVP